MRSHPPAELCVNTPALFAVASSVEFTEGIHYTNQATFAFPPAEAAAAAAAAPAGPPEAEIPEVPYYLQSAPATHWFPRDYVPVVHKNGAKTDREKWIEYFEEKVVCDHLETVYSPMRLCDKSKYSKDSNMNSRLLQYYVAKNNLDAPPGGKDTLANIKAVGRQHAKNKYYGQQEHMKGENLMYFEICLLLYEAGLNC